MRPSLLTPLRFYTSQVRENSRWESSLRSYYARMKAKLAFIISARCSLLANIIMSKNLDHVVIRVELAGFEPATPGMQNRCSTI